MLLRYLILFILVSKVSYNKCEEPFSRKISYLENLPTQTIFDIFEDRKGYIYLGTDKGLYKYNGIKFTHIYASNSLSNSVSSISQDSNGNIYCKNFSNQIFILNDDSLKTIPVLQDYLNNSHDLKEFIIVDNDIYLCTEKEFVKFNYDHGVDIVISRKNQQNFLFLDIIFNPANNSIVLAEISNIFLFKNNQTQIIESFKGDKKLHYFDDETFYIIKGTENAVFNLNNEPYQFNGNKNSSFTNLRNTKEELWLCTTNGLYKVNTKNKLINNPIFNQYRISDIIIDDEENYWISTLDQGLFFIPNIHLKVISPSNNNIYSNITRVVKSTDNNVFASTSQGKILKVNENSKELNQIESDYNLPVEFLYIDTISRTIMSSLGEVDIDKNKFKTSQFIAGKNLTPDNKGNYIFNTFRLAGLMSEDLKSWPNLESSDKFQKTYFGEKKIPIIIFLEKRTRTTFFWEKSDSYYIGAYDGLYTINSKGDFDSLKLNDKSPIIASHIQSDNEDLWIATYNSGIIKLNSKNQITVYNEQNGLSSSNCHRIFIENENIWILTDIGIEVLNKITGTIKQLETSYFLKGIGINDLIVSNKNLWLATNQGLLYIPIEKINQVPKPKIFINNIKVNNQPRYDNNFNFKYYENNIEFDVDAILFKSLGNYRYQYRLSGFDDVWIDKDPSINSIGFIALPPGKYIFELKASGNNQETDVLSVNFTILKPFWLTAWFLILIFIFLAIIAYSIFRFASSRARKNQLFEQKLTLSQLTALRAQMNPHFMFNVLNSVQGLIYSNKKREASEYLGKFSDLMRKTLENSDKKVINLEEEIENLKLYVELEAARFEDNLNFSIEIDKSIHAFQVKIPSMIIQPFVENAIKHGLLHKKGDKKLKIKISSSDDRNYLIVVIEDNGIGREASSHINQRRVKHKSFATKAIDTRINLFNKQLNKPIKLFITDLKVDGKIAAGTKIELQIPLDYE